MTEPKEPCPTCGHVEGTVSARTLWDATRKAVADCNRAQRSIDERRDSE